MTSFDGKVVVITGAASGIGLAMADRFGAVGADLVLSDVDDDALARALPDSRARIARVRADVTVPADMAQLRAAALDAYGRVDVVCLNAGVIDSGPLLETSLASWRRLVEINVMGVVHGIDAFVPGLVRQGSGHVVLTASAAGVMRAPGLGAYGATKHAVVGLAANLQAEVRDAGVGVSVLCPSVIRTALFEDSGCEHPHAATRELYAGLVAAAPGPEVVADAALRAIADDRLFVLIGDDIGGLVVERLRAVGEALPPRA